MLFPLVLNICRKKQHIGCCLETRERKNHVEKESDGNKDGSKQPERTFYMGGNFE